MNRFNNPKHFRFFLHGIIINKTEKESLGKNIP
jgi:hypothetical protein